MRKLLLLAIPLCLGFYSPEPVEVIDPEGERIPVYSFEEFNQLYLNRDTVYIVNFWATWCKPCVAELPEFEHIYDSVSGKPVKIILASLDFKKNWESGLVSFVKKKKLRPEVVVLYETDGNKWIPRIDPDWSGAIPATLIVRGEEGWFKEGGITSAEVLEVVNMLL